MNVTALEFSMSKDVIGYQAGIFEFYSEEEDPQYIEKDYYIENWCYSKNSSSNPYAEILIKSPIGPGINH